MFCYQCQEASKGTGCAAAAGVCGKTDMTARYQDLLLHMLKGIGWLFQLDPKAGASVEGLDRFVIEGLFATITNANFDTGVFERRITEALSYREAVRNAAAENGTAIPDDAPDAVLWTPAPGSTAEYDIKSNFVGVLATENERYQYPRASPGPEALRASVPPHGAGYLNLAIPAGTPYLRPQGDCRLR